MYPPLVIFKCLKGVEDKMPFVAFPFPFSFFIEAIIKNIVAFRFPMWEPCKISSNLFHVIFYIGKRNGDVIKVDA